MGRNIALRENTAFLKGEPPPECSSAPPCQASPWIESLKIEYHKEGLDGWKNQKVYLICKIFRCTLKELCAWSGLYDEKQIAECEKKISTRSGRRLERPSHRLLRPGLRGARRRRRDGKSDGKGSGVTP